MQLLYNMIGLNDIKPFGDYRGYKTGFQGTLKKAMTSHAIFQMPDKKLSSEGDGGIIGVMNSLAQQFGIETEFINVPTGL